jgi:putative membrane protein
MLRFLAYWGGMAVALAVAAWILPGVHLASPVAWLVGALVLGVMNALVRPILTFLTLPITVLTLGLFYLVVNGVAFALSAWLVPGFTVDSFGSAIVAALLVSLVSWFIARMSRERVPPERPTHA